MARGKVQMKKIENPVHRQVTFCKRRAGLLKKAKELSILCDADIGIIMFSDHGKLFELATNGTMQGLIERYRMTSGESQSVFGHANQPQTELEISMLKQEIDLLYKRLRYMLGERSVEQPTINEFQVLEKHLENWMRHIRTAKMQIMLQEIQALKKKEDLLKATNEFLQEKIVEQNEAFDLATNSMILQQNEHFNVTQTTDDNIPYPLTIQNEYYSYFRSSEMGFSY